jgi:hypothetical protein
MLYDLPASMQTPQMPNWPNGKGSISATLLPSGTAVQLPVLKGVNVLTFGVVGTGKTSSFTEPAAEILLSSDPEMKGVFFETKHSFIKRFMHEDDKVITHNPKAVPAKNLFVPNIIKEIRQATDSEAEMRDVAEFLFSGLLNGANQNRAWIEAARNTFIGVLRTIVDCYPTSNTGNGTLVNALRRMTTKDLLAYLAQHPRNHAMLRCDWGYNPPHPTDYAETRRAVDIRFFLNQVFESFSGSFALDGEDTIHHWLSGKYGRNLFFLYDLTSAEISRPFFLYYLKKIKDFKLSSSARPTPPILMVLDEIDKLADSGKAADWGLFQAANLGREYNLQILLTTQSVENLYGLSSDFNEHITTGGLAGFPYLISFRPGDPTTVSMLQNLYGSEHKEHLLFPASRYAEPIVKCELEPIVTDTEFASLDTGDCIVKIMSHRPQKVHINLGQ